MIGHEEVHECRVDQNQNARTAAGKPPFDQRVHLRTNNQRSHEQAHMRRSLKAKANAALRDDARP